MASDPPLPSAAKKNIETIVESSGSYCASSLRWSALAGR